MSPKSSTPRSESVFAQFSAAIKGFIIRHSPDPQDAEDIMHDVFYKFFVADAEQQIIENVSAWLYRVTRNTLIDRGRKKREQRMSPSVQQLAEQRDSASDTEQGLAMELLEAEFDAALSTLPAEQREVYLLNEVEGITFKEISQATGVPLNTLISRKRYATEHIRRELSWLYEEL